ncbi:MAG: M67 family metallopeptidase [Gemmatimonadetes bacterium]|nr:M67 family metallopeptidase [Gemmatimonadota bacterium]
MAARSRGVEMFDKAIWNAMFVHAQWEYPAECCGIVTEDASGVQTIHPCENIQDKLHAADPETHPRTSRTAYRMNDMHVMKIQSEAEQAGGRIVAIYHSHIDVDAYFSQEDQDAATFFGEPTYPGVVYPIIPVKNARVDVGGEKVFQWRDSSSKFEEVEIR